MSAGWSCPHNQSDTCAIRQSKACQPGYPGCVLFGKIRFADPNHPANKALDAMKAEKVEPADTQPNLQYVDLRSKQ